MRALFSPVLFSSILLSSVAYGSSLQPGPYGSAPTGKSFILTFDASADTRSSYVVDSKGFFWPTTSGTPSGTRIGGFAANDDTSSKGFSPTNLSATILNTRGVSGSSGLAGFFSSGGGGINGLWASKGFGEGPDFGAGNKGAGLLGSLSDPGPSGLGAEGIRGSGPSVSTTPLPASWTMMLIGLLAFGLLTWLRRPKMPENRPHPASLA